MTAPRESTLRRLLPIVALLLLPFRVWGSDCTSASPYMCPAGAGNVSTCKFTFPDGSTEYITSACGIPNNPWYNGACALGSSGPFPGQYADGPLTQLAGQRSRCFNSYTLSPDGTNKSAIGNGKPTKVMIAGGAGIIPTSWYNAYFNNSGTYPGLIPQLLKDGFNVIEGPLYEMHSAGKLSAGIDADQTSIVIADIGSPFWWPTGTTPNYVIVMCDNLPTTPCEQMLATDGGSIVPGAGSWGTTTITVTRNYNRTPSQSHTAGHPAYVCDLNGVCAAESGPYNVATNDLTGSPPGISIKDVNCFGRFMAHVGYGNGTFSVGGGSQGAWLAKMWDLVGSRSISDSTCSLNGVAISDAPVRPYYVAAFSFPASYSDPALRKFWDDENGDETAATAFQLGPGYPGILYNDSTAWASGIKGANCPDTNHWDCSVCKPATDSSGVIPINPTAAYTQAKQGGPRGCLPGGSCIFPQNSQLAATYVITGDNDNSIWCYIQQAYSKGSGTQEFIFHGDHLGYFHPCGDGINYCIGEPDEGWFRDVNDCTWGYCKQVRRLGMTKGSEGTD